MAQAARMNEDGELVIDTYALWENCDPEFMEELAKHEIFHKRLVEGLLDVLTDRSGYMWEHDYRGGWQFDPRDIREVREKIMEHAPEIVRTAFRAATSHARHYWSNYWREKDYSEHLASALRKERRYVAWLESWLNGRLDEDEREGFLDQRKRKFGRSRDGFPVDHGRRPDIPDRPDWNEGFHYEAEDAERKAKVDALLESLEASGLKFEFTFPEKDEVPA